ncbi:dTDP-glucose 4,6-dehydratase [Paraburkholderia phymatum]|uniref:dTDP-glucose 4,6-dehydratase n=1 Tax=Paraburkholderia phymatum (strain DSM 17167 / CIP 108236 / LMG 21445 / STM815) TaxID=391038 RepID=B2JT45_PARP8|nr:dTDP-glucose 4,6-dehydratase [Paraburkholderia phymatum]ACC75748.1 dTDP-glucose 4,6-dehydratase [Paraburkholderia phymatum STM815]
MILVTGGAGFIGANFVIDWLNRVDETVVNVDKLTYAGNLGTLESLRGDPSHIFVREDICDSRAMDYLLDQYQPRAILHFAAESHVDRSIHGPGEFMHTNVVGTFTLLEAAHRYWQALPSAARDEFRFLHVSTDEVFGSLSMHAPPFSERSPYAPNSPYSASKASSDHLVRAWHHTYGLPTLTTHCSNNYGPYQFPEKLIPLTITRALAGKPLPLYGDGLNVRDWLYVGDHCNAIRAVLAKGRPGDTYNIGGWNEVANIDVVHALCRLLDERLPKASGSYLDQIKAVADRPGHDRRYAIDAGKLERELGWTPEETFETGLRRTVDWYLAHQRWVSDVTSGAYLKLAGADDLIDA